MNALIFFVVFVPVGFALALLTDLFRARTRRGRLDRWVRRQGLTLKSAGYKFRFFRPFQYFRTLVPFEIVVVDRTGHETYGTAWASGFVRRQVWVDW
jgi:hypothetical protein